MVVRGVARRARDLWIYFKSGHSGYFVFILSLANFVVIQYNLLIERIPFLQQVVPTLGSFLILFSLLYLPLAIIIGYFEIKRGATMRSHFLNPYLQDTLESHIRLRRSLMHFYLGEKDESIRELEASEEYLLKWRNEL